MQSTRRLRASIRTGHPWIYDRAVRSVTGVGQRGGSAIEPGQVVAICHGGRAIAAGFIDPGAPIAARVLDLDPAVEFDHAWVSARVERAARYRALDPSLSGESGLRVLHGENDELPGLVIDRYRDTGVVVFDGAAAAAFWRPRMDAVRAGLERAGIALARLWAKPSPRRAASAEAGSAPRGRGEHGGKRGGGEHSGKRGGGEYSGKRGGGGAHGDQNDPSGAAGGCLYGTDAPELIMIDEAEARFEVDVRRGQKTGFFLDQRRNRRRVASLCAGAEVLNLFSYTGGFSVHAALGGARRVTSVDIAEPAIAAARRNFAHSGLDPAQHGFHAEDAFDFLARAAGRGARYDLVVVDPPSFAPSERARQRALRAYERVNRAALEVVEAGGWLVSCSCSSHVSTDDLLAALASAASRAGRQLRVAEIHGADRDHPVKPGFPEGRYLDFVLAAVT